jgi:hypothetical protein
MRHETKQPAFGFASTHALGSVASAVMLLATLAWPDTARAVDFEKGTTNVLLSVGFGSAAGDSYYSIGAGIGYYLFNGFAAGISAESRQGLEPDLTKVTPWLEYAFGLSSTVRPYVGAFYRHTSVSGYDDYETWGYRGGLYVRAGRNVWGYAGLVQEELIDCNGLPATVSCSDTYSEVGVVFSF